MPRKARKLSGPAISKRRADGRYSVGGVDGLHLRVAGNSREWGPRAMVGSSRRGTGLGSISEPPLAEAWKETRELRRQVRDDIDPLQEETRGIQSSPYSAKKTILLPEMR